MFFPFSLRKTKKQAVIQKQPTIQVDPLERLTALRDWHMARAEHYKAIILLGDGSSAVWERWNHSAQTARKLNEQLNAALIPQQLTLF